MRSGILLIAVFLLLLFVNRADACSCNFRLPPCEAFKETPAIFIALVTDIDPRVKEAKEPRFAHLSIERAFKGITEAKIKMYQGTASGDCSIPFEKGERYLIYAVYDEETKQFFTNSCTRTTPLEYAAEDLDYLDGLPNSNRGNRLSGIVVKDDYEDSESPSVPELISGTTVIAKDENGRHFEAVTNSQGFFKMVDLPPGRYQVSALLPSYLINDDHMPSMVEVPSAGCASVSILARTDGRVSGVLRDAQGLVASGILVELIPFELSPKLEELKDRPFLGRVEETASDGRFEFTELRPGRYLLGVNMLRTPNAKNPFLRTFFPGVPQLAEAKIIHLEKGQKLTGFDLRLPPRLRVIEIKGVVVWQDGRAATKAYVSFTDTADRRSGRSLESAYGDDRGRFILKLLEGQEGWLHASVMIPVKTGIDVIWAKSVKVTAKGRQRSMRFVVSTKALRGVEILPW